MHFHGFFGWESEQTRTEWCLDSGTVSVPGRKAPVRVRSEAHRQKLLAAGGRVVWNLPRWKWGFTTAIDLYGDYHQAVTYVCKYIRKQQEAGTLSGRWYYHGGCNGRPVVKLSNQALRDFEGYPGAHQFHVQDAGCSFIRIVKKGET